MGLRRGVICRNLDSMFRTVSDEVGVRFLQSAQGWAERRGAFMRRRRQSASLRSFMGPKASIDCLERGQDGQSERR
jgi:hypothetical protein